ncbi:MAG: MFS transporter [Moraxella sp.]
MSKNNINDDFNKDKKFLSMILVFLILLSVNMRSPIVMIGSLADILNQSLGLSPLYLGYLGALPLPLFALGALITPRLIANFGLMRLIVVVTTILTVAILLRVWVGMIGVFIGTFVLSLMIGILNVAIAPFIKQYLPNHITIATGIFSLSMSVSAGFLAWLVVPLSKMLNWQFSLSVWAIFAALAVLIFIIRIQKISQVNGVFNQKTNQNLTINNGFQTHFLVWKNKMAWYLGVFFGLQSLLFYSVASFLSLVGVSYGLSNEQASVAVLVFQFAAPVAIFMMTALIKRNFSIKIIALTSAICNAIGAFGLIVLPDFLYLSSAMMGFGGSAIFTLVLMLFSLKTSSLQAARDLSGMVQVVGYVIAFFGPLILGKLYEKTGTWELSLQVLFVLMCVNIGFGWLAGRGDKVDSQC